MKAGVLLSVGMHRGSGRQRVSHADLSALRLAQLSGMPVVGIHAGGFADLLKDYGAYGLRELVLVPGGAAGIARFAAESGIDLLIAGCMGEGSFAQGMLPYIVAQALHWDVIPAAVRLEAGDGTWKVAARLDGMTERRYVNVSDCLLVSHGAGAEQMTYAAEQRERLSIRAWDSRDDTLREPSHGASPGGGLDRRRMPQPPWTLPDAAQPARDRLAALRGEGAHSRGKVVIAPTPDDACRQLLGALRQAGFKIDAQRNQGVQR